jgi:hypothetical protein
MTGRMAARDRAALVRSSRSAWGVAVLGQQQSGQGQHR